MYIEILVILRAIFFRCRLVHADFSEYNILCVHPVGQGNHRELTGRPHSYHQGHLWVIDVSQSVEHEHPAAFDFLRADIKNADDFFARRGVDTLGLTRTFNFVTRDTWVENGREETDEDAAKEVERLLAQAEAEEEDRSTAAATASLSLEDQDKAAAAERPSASDEAVFAQSFIPRALDDVFDVERDVARVLRGEGKDLIYADITGVASIHKKGEKAIAEEEDEDDDEDDEDEGSQEGDSDDESGDEDGEKAQRPRGKKFEDKDEKKVPFSQVTVTTYARIADVRCVTLQKRRQEVKEAAREKRASKMKKSEKARRVKKTSGKR